jgi:hypothetical protein
VKALIAPADALDEAREMAARANQGVLIIPGAHTVRIGFVCVEPFDAPPYETLAELLDQDGAPGGAPWYVYPNGLAQRAADVNWFWRMWEPDGRGDFRPAVRLGSALQAARFCARFECDPRDVQCVHPDDVHGACVFTPGPRFHADRRDWRMVQARPFPAWTLPPGSFRPEN